MNNQSPSSIMRYKKKKITINGLNMAYVDEGTGDPIVFLHGNPTSSYLWRNIIPHLEGLGRCIAPDLIGMGDSDKLPNSGPHSYRYVEHREYLFALLEAIGVERNVVLVIHDWGSSLGFDWARQFQSAVKGIAYMEAVVMPFTWEGQSEGFTQFFGALRSPAGEKMVLENNLFIEEFLQFNSVLRKLGPDEMAEYRRPFADPGEDRRPTLTWPRQIALDGKPEDVHAVWEDYSAWLPTSEIPKLFIDGEPGLIMAMPGTREFCRTFANQVEVTTKGIHFLQEDSPDEIGQAIANWYLTL